jgi:hypothetical protein
VAATTDDAINTARREIETVVSGAPTAAPTAAPTVQKVFDAATGSRPNQVFTALTKEYTQGTGTLGQGGVLGFWGRTREANQDLLPALAYVTRMVGEITPEMLKGLMKGGLNKDTIEISRRVLLPMETLFGSRGPGAASKSGILKPLKSWLALDRPAVASARRQLEKAHPGVELKYATEGPTRQSVLTTVQGRSVSGLYQGTKSEVEIAKRQIAEQIQRARHKPSAGQREALEAVQVAKNRWFVLRDVLQGLHSGGLELAQTAAAKGTRVPSGVPQFLSRGGAQPQVFNVASGRMEHGQYMKTAYDQIRNIAPGFFEKGRLVNRERIVEVLNVLNDANANLLMFIMAVASAQSFGPEAIFGDEMRRPA